jgi:hypothetical protein
MKIAELLQSLTDKQAPLAVDNVVVSHNAPTVLKADIEGVEK